MSDTWAPAFYTFHISPAFNFPSSKSHIVRSGKHLFEVFSGREVAGGEKASCIYTTDDDTGTC